MENQQKIDNLVLHFASRASFMGKKKLAKLLYFVDFTHFELTGKSVTGLKYKKEKFGPLPETFYPNLERMKRNNLIEVNEKEITHTIEPHQEPDYSVFDDKEKEVIDAITGRFKDFDAKSLEVQAQNEPPYIMVSPGEEIPYHLAYYRNSFDEITLADEVTNS